MSGSLSLQSSVRTCKVSTGDSTRLQSDRFLNPSNMVCIPWDGKNNKGQVVHTDTFNNKTPGCSNPKDIVSVENDQRPKYASYITLNMNGVNGNLYEQSGSGTVSNSNKRLNSRTGNFGKQLSSNVEYRGCTVGKDGSTSYDKAMATLNRNQSYASNGYASEHYRRASGGF